MLRSNRQSKILELIHSYEIDTQEELVQRLAQAGYRVTQATISRDVKELGLVKTQGENGNYRYTTVKAMDFKISTKFINVFREAVISMVVANNLLVIKTLVGSANAAAMVVDQMHLNESLGSLAGDDTLLLIAHSEEDANTIKEKLTDLIESF